VSFGARALIRLGALGHNLNLLRSAAPRAKVMAVIKANAYGHGMEAVALQMNDVDSFAVARLPEALRLRAAGVDKPIVLLAGVVSNEELLQSTEQGFEIVVHCREQIDLLSAYSGSLASVWLKFDTGMNRLGFHPDEAAELMSSLSANESIADLRLMTHMSAADDQDTAATKEQTNQFREITDGFSGAVSFANSPATLSMPEVVNASSVFGFSGDHWIRPGIALFGISPFSDRSAADLGLNAVMQFEARLISTKTLLAGARVGYKGRYYSDADSTLGIIAAGYGDGYSRHFRDGTPVLINGRRVPLIGNVSMDMIAVDLGPDAKDAVGDVATLWGDGLPVEEVAPWANAIPYELVCGVTNREESEIIL
jgi:alanine racemase